MKKYLSPANIITVAGGVLAFYVTWLTNIPGIAGHLLSASVMSAPAALAIAKIIYPEVEVENIDNNIKLSNSKQSSNVIEALGSGASDGLKLAVNVGAMLIAFISIIAPWRYLQLVYDMRCGAPLPLRKHQVLRSEAANNNKNIIISEHDIEKDIIQPASIDLRLGIKAWRVPASFLPGKGNKVSSRLKMMKMYCVL